ncbi:MAG: hypothetical protein KKA60_03805 [Proteobacteria bacterium]|nr:hypothetical protein [Pseudomonadota bacterium]
MSDELYYRIAENFDENAQGAPRSEDGAISGHFIDYLKVLYTPEEVELVQHLRCNREFPPTRFQPENMRTAEDIAELAGKDIVKVRRLLDDLSRKNLPCPRNPRLT